MAILGMDIEVQTVEDNVISLEMLFKTWLHDHSSEREQLHLLLPSGAFGHAAAPKNTLSISFSPLSAPFQGVSESLSLKSYPGLSYRHLPSHLETQVRSVWITWKIIRLTKLLFAATAAEAAVVSILQQKCAWRGM